MSEKTGSKISLKLGSIIHKFKEIARERRDKRAKLHTEIQELGNSLTTGKCEGYKYVTTSYVKY